MILLHAQRNSARINDPVCVWIAIYEQAVHACRAIMGFANVELKIVVKNECLRSHTICICGFHTPLFSVHPDDV